MRPTPDWWPRCAFIRDYFFGGEQKVAQQLAEYLARYYVGEGISELRPNTDVSALVGDSIRKHINVDDFTMDRGDDLFAEVDLKESITFSALVSLVRSQRGLSAY
ncbi:MAG: hypothetical protein ABI640_08590 [Gammaproteobacteria bacterium]